MVVVEELLQEQHIGTEVDQQDEHLFRIDARQRARPCQRQREVEREEEGAKEGRRQQPVRLIEAVVPGREVADCGQERGRAEHAEAAQVGDSEQPRAEDGEVAEESDLGVGASAQQGRCQKAAGQCQNGETLGVLADREGDHGRRHNDQRAEDCGQGKKVVERPGCVHREIDDPDAESGHAFGEVPHAPADQPLCVDQKAQLH